MKTKGRPPYTLTGQFSVSADSSPWWDDIMSKLESFGAKVGMVISIENLTQMIPAYPGGRRARARTVARRLGSCLELISRGPNGSKGKGAMYRVLKWKPPAEINPDDDIIQTNNDWLDSAVEKMTRTKKRK